MPQIAPIVYYAVAAGAAGYSAYASAESRSDAKKAQNQILESQQKAVAEAEEKSKAAEKLATEQATEKRKKYLMAQTQTILTTPLGVSGDAETKRPVLLGSA